MNNIDSHRDLFRKPYQTITLSKYFYIILETASIINIYKSQCTLNSIIDDNFYQICFIKKNNELIKLIESVPIIPLLCKFNVSLL